MHPPLIFLFFFQRSACVRSQCAEGCVACMCLLMKGLFLVCGQYSLTHP